VSSGIPAAAAVVVVTNICSSASICIVGGSSYCPWHCQAWNLLGSDLFFTFGMIFLDFDIVINKNEKNFFLYPQVQVL
jgi:hypothetical protein